jgi:hypothetical protein
MVDRISGIVPGLVPPSKVFLVHRHKNLSTRVPSLFLGYLRREVLHHPLHLLQLSLDTGRTSHDEATKGVLKGGDFLGYNGHSFT